MNGNAAFSPYHAAHRLAEYNNHALSTVFNYCPAASAPVSTGRLLLLLSMPALLLLLLLRQPLDASPHKKLINLFMNICGAQKGNVRNCVFQCAGRAKISPTKILQGRQ